MSSTSTATVLRLSSDVHGSSDTIRASSAPLQSTASPSTPTSLRDECRIISSWVLNSRNAVTENSSDPPVHHSCALVSKTTEEKNMFERNNTSTEAATDMTVSMSRTAPERRKRSRWNFSISLCIMCSGSVRVRRDTLRLSCPGISPKTVFRPAGCGEGPCRRGYSIQCAAGAAPSCGLRCRTCR